jgi:undecaprenyl-phosphate 4-deoxy-4-formamido-L-arabinose transferase
VRRPVRDRVVNDASRDGSWDVLVELRRRHGWIRPIDLMRNSGQHNALLCGIRAARYDLIVTLDDDLQNPPEEIPKLLDALEDHIDVVYGAPCQEVHGRWRDLASQATKIALQRVLGAETARMVGPFRVFRTDLRRAFDDYEGALVNIDVLLTWGTTRFKAIRVGHHERRTGQSNYTFWKLLTHSLNMLTGFSTAPLQWASMLGFAVTLFGMLLFAFVLGRYVLQGASVPGFAFLASVIIIFSGAQLLTLGIIGEYLARIHFRLMDRPSYTVKSGDAAAVARRVEGHPSATSRYSIEEIRRFWGEQAVTHRQSPDASWSDRMAIELEIQQLLEHIQDGDRVLDIGCANGYSTLRLASRRAIEILGLDYIPEMVEQARARLEAERHSLTGRVVFDVGDITALDRPAGAFDKVIVIRVLISLRTWDNQVKGLTEALRMLKPGGTLLLSEATRQGWERLNGFRREWGLPDIPMPSFNEYLDLDRVIEAARPHADLVDVVHFASTYYVMTRVLKPLLIEALGRPIDVADPGMEWNRFAAQLPPGGDYGVQQLMIFRKR